MLHNFSRIFIILLSFAVYGSSDSNPTLFIEETKLVGSFHENGEVEMFLGLPFARPPIGEMRWKKPHPWMPIPEEEIYVNNLNRLVFKIKELFFGIKD